MQHRNYWFNYWLVKFSCLKILRNERQDKLFCIEGNVLKGKISITSDLLFSTEAQILLWAIFYLFFRQNWSDLIALPWNLMVYKDKCQMWSQVAVNVGIFLSHNLWICVTEDNQNFAVFVSGEYKRLQLHFQQCVFLGSTNQMCKMGTLSS